ncbi:hypothetical protein C2E23DRAFT_409096 [Lenzites betulinus]|nr:hypothetical protein C2E23DRAFT_409096 [Lenzites betulinus]
MAMAHSIYHCWAAARGRPPHPTGQGSVLAAACAWEDASIRVSAARSKSRTGGARYAWCVQLPLGMRIGTSRCRRCARVGAYIRRLCVMAWTRGISRSSCSLPASCGGTRRPRRSQHRRCVCVCVTCLRSQNTRRLNLMTSRGGMEAVTGGNGTDDVTITFRAKHQRYKPGTKTGRNWSQ